MRTYYQNENDALIAPIILFDTFNSLKEIKPPLKYQEMHQNVIEKFKYQPIDITLSEIESIFEEETNFDRNYGEAIF
jgi:hypothetical protein